MNPQLSNHWGNSNVDTYQQIDAAPLELPKLMPLNSAPVSLSTLQPYVQLPLPPTSVQSSDNVFLDLHYNTHTHIHVPEGLYPLLLIY